MRPTQFFEARPDAVLGLALYPRQARLGQEKLRRRRRGLIFFFPLPVLGFVRFLQFVFRSRPGRALLKPYNIFTCLEFDGFLNCPGVSSIRPLAFEDCNHRASMK